MRIVNGQEMAEIDRRTIQDFHIDGQLLMESAGRAAAQVIAENWPGPARLCILCGPGNNGGDGFVIARTWHNRGGRVSVYTLAPAESYRGDALLNLQRLQSCGLNPQRLDSGHLPSFTDCDLIVDALFGTGLARPLEGFVAEVVEAVNALSLPVLAIDIPSGVDAATGEILGCAIRAERTVTFGLPKLGHHLHPGAQLRGSLHIHEIGFPKNLLEDPSRGGILVEHDLAARLLPRRSPTSHKGSNGKVLLWAGSQAYPGAATLCGRGALRGGAGLVFLAAPSAVGDLALQHLPEMIRVPIEPSPEDRQIQSYMKGCQALCIGPGFGREPERLASVTSILSRDDLPPTVIDADALRALPERLGSPGCILTPHHGELAHLMGVTPEEIRNQRLLYCRQAAQRWGCVVILKGAPSLIADSTGAFWVNTSGHPVLAQGGTGDVLSGLITALLGQGLKALEAALLGAYIHGLAGQRQAQTRADRGVLAREIADEIPGTLRYLQSKGNCEPARSGL